MPSATPAEITLLLDAARAGDAAAKPAVMEAAYNEFRRIAHALVRMESPSATLQATLLVHEAYLKMADVDLGSITNRRHLMSLARNIMKRLLVDRARRAASEKHGGKAQRQAIVDVAEGTAMTTDPAIFAAIHNALAELEAVEPEVAEVIWLRYLAGLSLQEIADFLDVSKTAATNWWNFGRAWIRRALARQGFVE